MLTFFYEWLTAGCFKAFNVLFLSSNKFKVLQILLLLMKMASLKAKVAEQSIFQGDEQKISLKLVQKKPYFNSNKKCAKHVLHYNICFLFFWLTSAWLFIYLINENRM